MTRVLHSDVRVGDRFYEVGHFAPRWVVRELYFPGPSNIPFAVIDQDGAEGRRDRLPVFLLLSTTRFGRDQRRASREQALTTTPGA